MKINVIFYQDYYIPEYCNVLGVFKYKSKAKLWLIENGWYFNSELCYWYSENETGYAEILEKELQ